MFGGKLDPDTDQIPSVVKDCVDFLETPGKDYLQVIIITLFFLCVESTVF